MPEFKDTTESVAPEQKDLSNNTTKSIVPEPKDVSNITKSVESEQKDVSNITKSVKSEQKNVSNNTPNSETPKQEKEFEWMVRPCEIYYDEYKDCKSIKARFHQYFVFGKIIECNQWKTDYNNCCLWNNHKSEEAYNELINSETQRRMVRWQGHYNNNIWTKRDKPPENWNVPLPEWMIEEHKNSFLKHVSDKLKNEENGVRKSSCSIM